MYKRSLAIALMHLAPRSRSALSAAAAVAAVQRGDKQADFSDMNSTIKLSNKDIENVSPLKLLIDKRKDLKLTDDQLAKLKDREDKLKESMKPSFGALDSLRRVSAPAGRTADEGDKARTDGYAPPVRRSSSPEFVRSTTTRPTKRSRRSIRSQQKQATDLVQKQKTEADDMIRDKFGGGPGTRGSGRRH